MKVPDSWTDKHQGHRRESKHSIFRPFLHCSNRWGRGGASISASLFGVARSFALNPLNLLSKPLSYVSPIG